MGRDGQCIHFGSYNSYDNWCVKFDDLCTLQLSCVVMPAKYQSGPALLASVSYRSILELIKWLYEWSLVGKEEKRNMRPSGRSSRFDGKRSGGGSEDFL